MPIELELVREKNGRAFEVGRRDRCGLVVERILRVGNYVTVYLGAATGRVRTVLLHMDDLSVVQEVGL